jgi:hypothetical protein
MVREFAEELGAVVKVARIIDSWLYEVLPQREVVIITYGVQRCEEEELRVSDEHRRLGLFTLQEIEALPIPEGYRRSIRMVRATPMCKTKQRTRVGATRTTCIDADSASGTCLGSSVYRTCRKCGIHANGHFITNTAPPAP